MTVAPDFRKRDITVRYEDESHPNISSSPTQYPARDVAKRVWYDWDDYFLGRAPKIISITVDGETFTNEELRF